MNNDDIVIIYTDGSSNGSRGIGGWAAILMWKDHKKEIFGYEEDTTNNRMELMAAIKAIESLKRPVKVILYSDSRYVIDGATRWVPCWKNNGWKTKFGDDVKNVDLWKRLDAARDPHFITWKWVRGHNGDYYNEMADRLAREARLLKKTSE